MHSRADLRYRRSAVNLIDDPQRIGEQCDEPVTADNDPFAHFATKACKLIGMPSMIVQGCVSALAGGEGNGGSGRYIG